MLKKANKMYSFGAETLETTWIVYLGVVSLKFSTQCKNIEGRI